VVLAHIPPGGEAFLWLDGSYGKWGLRHHCIQHGFHGGVIHYAGVGNMVVSGGEWEEKLGKDEPQ